MTACGNFPAHWPCEESWSTKLKVWGRAVWVVINKQRTADDVIHTIWQMGKGFCLLCFVLKLSLTVYFSNIHNSYNMKKYKWFKSMSWKHIMSCVLGLRKILISWWKRVLLVQWMLHKECWKRGTIECCIISIFCPWIAFLIWSPSLNPNTHFE